MLASRAVLEGKLRFQLFRVHVWIDVVQSRSFSQSICRYGVNSVPASGLWGGLGAARLDRPFRNHVPFLPVAACGKIADEHPCTFINRLAGVGVGDANASPTAALLLSVLQDSMGRTATILFADRLGTAFEPECKMYRFTADILNDTGMVLECLSPAFPKPIRVCVLSCSSVLRSLCGVCAGSAKASLSAHFARKGNLGEVNAVGSLFWHMWSLLHVNHGCRLFVENEDVGCVCVVLMNSILDATGMFGWNACGNAPMRTSG